MSFKDTPKDLLKEFTFKWTYLRVKIIRVIRVIRVKRLKLDKGLLLIEIFEYPIKTLTLKLFFVQF